MLLFALGAAMIAATSGCAGGKPHLKSTATSEAVVAEGMAPVMNGDSVAAQKAALQDALKNAVGLVVGVYVSQEALVSKAALIEDNISAQSAGYIERYDTQKQGRDGEFYKVTVKALVRKEDLSKKIQAMDLEPRRLGNPIVSVAMTESVDGRPDAGGTAAAALKRSFVDAGFVVTSSTGADIVIEGTATSVFNTDEGLAGLTSYRATFSVVARMAASGDVITTLQETAGGIDANRPAAAQAALRGGAQKIGRTMPDAILVYLKNRSTTQLILDGIPSLNILTGVTRSLRALIEVRDCRVRSYEGGRAVIDIDMKRGTAGDLARRLEQSTSFTYGVRKTTTYAVEAILLTGVAQ